MHQFCQNRRGRRTSRGPQSIRDCPRQLHPRGCGWCRSMIVPRWSTPPQKDTGSARPGSSGRILPRVRAGAPQSSRTTDRPWRYRTHSASVPITTSIRGCRGIKSAHFAGVRHDHPGAGGQIDGGRCRCRRRSGKPPLECDQVRCPAWASTPAPSRYAVTPGPRWRVRSTSRSTHGSRPATRGAPRLTASIHPRRRLRRPAARSASGGAW